MKLISMHVDNFGGLRSYDYDFSEGLNVILQDNGWGKTTMAAFLKAMLYGFDSKRSKDITENERKKYYPWQGGSYGGTLDFEAEKNNYRIYRTFGLTSKGDSVRVVNLDKNITARIDPTKIGETLFKLDANAFQRSVFINQNGLSMDNAASSIHTRLNSIVSQANDVAAFDGAITALTQQVKIYEKTGSRGLIADINRQIEELQRQRVKAEKDIAEQDEARKRVLQIDQTIADINKQLVEKKKKLDEISGANKRQEANNKVIADLDKQIADLKQQLADLQNDLGGVIPTDTIINQVKKNKQVIANSDYQIRQLDEQIEKISEDYNKINIKYNGKLPTQAQLDELQNAYGKIAGATSASVEVKNTNDKLPLGYTLIKKAMDEDPEYVNLLQISMNNQDTLKKLIKNLETLEAEIYSEEKSWKDKKKRYESLKAEVNEAQKDIDNDEKYKTANLEGTISKLEKLQSLQQSVNIRQEELKKVKLTDYQQQLLVDAPKQLPTTIECNEIVSKVRDICDKQNYIKVLSSQLEGEKIKLESIKSSLDQISSVVKIDIKTVEKPSGSSGPSLIFAGFLVMIAAIALAVLVKPILALTAIIGVILIVLGTNANKKHKKQLEAYQSYQSALEKNRPMKTRQDELTKQVSDTQNSCVYHQQTIDDVNKTISAEKEKVYSWLEKWEIGNVELSESSFRIITDSFSNIQRFRNQDEEYKQKKKYVEEKSQTILTEFNAIKEIYPEIAKCSVSEALGQLRTIEFNCKIKDTKAKTALDNYIKFIKEEKLSEEEFAQETSPVAAKLKKNKAKTLGDLQLGLNLANEMLSPLELSVSTNDVDNVYRKAERMIDDYYQCVDKQKELDDRLKQKQAVIDDLQEKLQEKCSILQGCYSELSFTDRLANVRKDIDSFNKAKDNIEKLENDKKGLKDNSSKATLYIEGFIAIHGKFKPSSSDVLSEIINKTEMNSVLQVRQKEVEKQKANVLKTKSSEGIALDAKEEGLCYQIAEIEKKKETLLIENTQKNDLIRQADQSLEKYPDIIREIQQLYDQKQKAINKVAMLNKTIQLIKTAKENLADRYLSKVEDTFNNYMQVWLGNDSIRGILDINFNVRIEENDAIHVAEGYSTGYCDLIDFCMRLALVDTLFVKEQPFLILDDPFVNLDEEHLQKALELLNVMSADKQIIYFICHPIRGVEVDADSISKQEFAQLTKKTRKAISERKNICIVNSKTSKKLPKDMYKVVNNGIRLPIRIVNSNYVITNNIFSLNFAVENASYIKQATYELFFIDSIGHILNERKILEINDGKLSNDKIQFCLNSRDDSGNQYELMIKNSAQEDYEVLERIPFKASLSFVGTDSFDF